MPAHQYKPTCIIKPTSNMTLGDYMNVSSLTEHKQNMYYMHASSNKYVA